jgi:membrane protein
MIAPSHERFGNLTGAAVKAVAKLFRHSIQRFGADRCTQMAAAISYYVLFSIIPLAVFSVSIFGFVVTDPALRERVTNWLVDTLPVEKGAGGSGQNLVADTLHGVSRVSAPLSVLGLVVLAWSASTMFGAVRRSLDAVWGVEGHRPFVQQKLVDFGILVGLGLILLLSLGVTGLLQAARAKSASFLGPLSEDTTYFWAAVSFVPPAVLSFLAFLGVYRLVPDAPVRVRDVWPGALLATVLFEVLKNVFAFYIRHFSNYDVVYGSLGAIMIFLLWTYLAANILLLGAEMAVEYPRVLRGEYDAEPGPAEPLTQKALRFARRLVFRERRSGGDSGRSGRGH